MNPIPAKPINELEKKTWITDQDLILIVDASTGEARVADKEELRGIGIENIKKSKSGKTTTLTIHTTDGGSYQVQLEDGDDGYTPEFKLEGTVFKWKFPNESQWTTLFDITSFKGEEGNDGVWISEITHTKRGKTTTITIKKTDGSSHPFNIEDGEKGDDGKNPEFQLWSTHLQWRLQGESQRKNLIPKDQIRGATITNIAKTAGNGNPWTTDTYTITLSDGQTFNFFVYNGNDGKWLGDMIKANNLSDVVDKAQARENLWAEAKENKKTDIEANKSSHSFFPTIKAVYDWVINKLNWKADTNHNHDSAYYKKTEVDTKLRNKADLVGGLVPANQLPSYVDDVLEYANRSAFPATGEKGKIYIAVNDDSQWRWTGTDYKKMVSSPWSTDAVPEGSQNLYFTPERAKNAVQNELNGKSNVGHNHTKAEVGLWKVDNTSDADKNSAKAMLTNKTINGDQNTIVKVNSLKNLKDTSELKLWTGNTANIPAPEAQQAGVIYFGFKQ